MKHIEKHKVMAFKGIKARGRDAKNFLFYFFFVRSQLVDMIQALTQFDYLLPERLSRPLRSEFPQLWFYSGGRQKASH